jgi:hypothetical protein
MPIDPSLFTGAAGGSLAIAFGAGCAAGYGFAIRTAYRAVKQRLDAVEQNAREEQNRCDMHILRLETRQRELEDMLLGRRPLGFFTAPSGMMEKD